MTCQLGLICEYETCPNQSTCYAWAYPWPLPYSYDIRTKTLTVAFYGLDLFEDLKVEMNKQWKQYGFYKAVSLPYDYDLINNALTVLWNQDGWFRAWQVPYKREVLGDGCRCLTVDYDLTRTEYALPVSKAGWLVAKYLPLTDDVPF